MLKDAKIYVEKIKKKPYSLEMIRQISLNIFLNFYFSPRHLIYSLIWLIGKQKLNESRYSSVEVLSSTELIEDT